MSVYALFPNMWTQTCWFTYVASISHVAFCIVCKDKERRAALLVVAEQPEGKNDAWFAKCSFFYTTRDSVGVTCFC